MANIYIFEVVGVRSLALDHKRSLALQHKTSLALQHKRSLALQHKRSLALQACLGRDKVWFHVSKTILWDTAADPADLQDPPDPLDPDYQVSGAAARTLPSTRAGG